MVPSCGLAGAKSSSHRRVLVPSAGFLLVLGLPATGPAQGPGVGALKQKSAALAARSQAAVLQLYALESRLAAGARRSRRRRRTGGGARRGSERRPPPLPRRPADDDGRPGAPRRAAAAPVRAGQPDPIAVILGATSLDEVIDGLESISRTARATESVIEQARSARHGSSAGPQGSSPCRSAGRARSGRRSPRRPPGLEQARAERPSYIAQLRRERS